jgi:hypothetical protein
MVLIALRWPRAEAFDDEIARASASAPEALAPTLRSPAAAGATPPRVPARSATHVTPRNG